MSGRSVRDEVVRLRRQGTLTPLPMGVAALTAAVVSFVHGDDTWTAWGAMLAVGAWLCAAVAKDARRRDAAVSTRDDDAVRAYLRGRLDGVIMRTTRLGIALGLGSALPFLLGAVYMTATTKHPANPAAAAQHFAFGAALVVTAAHRLLVMRPAMRRLRASLGEAPASSEPWLVDVARDISVAQGESHAAIFWHEATGVPMRTANAAVRQLSAAPSAARTDAAGAAERARSTEVVDGIKVLVRRDLAGSSIVLAILAALVAVQEWTRRVGADGPSSEGLTGAQTVYVLAAVLDVLGAAAQFSLHRAALAGAAASMRAHYRRELEKRLARASTWSKFELALVFFAVGFVAVASASLCVEFFGGRRVTAFPDLVESALFVAWFVALPWLSKRRLRPRLERERAALVGPSEPPPVP